MNQLIASLLYSMYYRDGGLRPQYQTEYRSMIIGELLFLFRFQFIASGLVDIVQEGSNQPIQTEGWPRKFLLQLLSDLPLLFQIKNFSVVDKIIIIFFEKLNYSTAFFPVYLLFYCLFLMLYCAQIY